jgi:hypothetical protein
VRVCEPADDVEVSYDLLASLPSSRRQAIPVAAGIAVLSGGFAAGLLPRFVTTVGDMFGLMFGGLLIGAAVAVALRSRWAILLAPIGHIISFELARALVFGPPVFSSGAIYSATRSRSWCSSPHAVSTPCSASCR